MFKKEPTTDPIAFERIIKKYYGQLHIHRFNNLVAMVQFLEIHKESNLTQDQIVNLNSLRSIKTN